jgi:hypothetical protein
MGVRNETETINDLDAVFYAYDTYVKRALAIAPALFGSPLYGVCEAWLRLSNGHAELVVRSDRGSEGTIRQSVCFDRALLLMSELNFSVWLNEQRERRRTRSSDGVGYRRASTALRNPASANKVRRNLEATIG